jgi:hypothetical protein
LIADNKSKFKLELKEDVWYLQTLQHLLKISLDSKSYDKSRALLRELEFIDSENANDYELEEKEINRIKRYKIFLILIYCGMGLLITSMIYRFVTSTNMGLTDGLGTVIGLIGIIGAYFNKDSMRKHSPQQHA